MQPGLYHPGVFVLFPLPARGKVVTVGEAEVAAHLESALLHTQQALFSLPVLRLRSLVFICGHTPCWVSWDTFLPFSKPY